MTDFLGGMAESPRESVGYEFGPGCCTYTIQQRSVQHAFHPLSPLPFIALVPVMRARALSGHSW